MMSFRTGTTNTTSASGVGNQATPAPAPALPTYHRSQAALRGATGQPPANSSSSGQQLAGGNSGGAGNSSVGPFLTSPASVVAPSPLPTPHSHAPPSVPPMGMSAQFFGNYDKFSFNDWFSRGVQIHLCRCRAPIRLPPMTPCLISSHRHPLVRTSITCRRSTEAGPRLEEQPTHLVDLNPMPYVI